jgi:hypothetical protein
VLSSIAVPKKVKTKYSHKKSQFINPVIVVSVIVLRFLLKVKKANPSRFACDYLKLILLVEKNMKFPKYRKSN